MNTDRQFSNTGRVDDLPPGHGRRLATAAGLALDRMRALAAEASPSTGRVTTASALFALCDMAKAQMFRSTPVFALIEQALGDRWPRLATERARYIAGRAPDLDEPPAPGATLLSTHAMRALSIARMLAGKHAHSRPLMAEDIVLGLLLCAPAAGEAVAAHSVLHRLDLVPLQLLGQWAELATV